MQTFLPILVLCIYLQLVYGTEATARTDGSGKTNKRALAEGNSGVSKRAPQQGSTGIEYADTTETLPDKSPAQQVYATPVPQLSKISDVLTGHGPAFPTAIANHLHSPLQLYQPLAKVGSPTRFEVSAPVPSQLAYSEHKTFYPGPSALQYNNIQFYNQPPKISPQPPKIYPQQPLNFARATALSYAAPQQFSYLQQPLYPVPQHLTPYSQIQPDYLQQRYQPVVNYVQNDQSGPENTSPQTFNQEQPTPVSGTIYSQSPPHTVASFAQQAASGAGFVQGFAPAHLQFSTSQTSYTAPGVIPKPIQRDLNSQPINVIDKNSDVDNQDIKNEVKPQGTGAVSYASFSQSTQANQAPTLQNAYIPSAPKHAVIPPQPQPSNTNYIPSAAKPPAGPAYGPVGQHIGQANVGYYPQPNFYHTAPQQVFVQGPTYQVPQVGYIQQNLAHTAPTFPAVQYYGKFAQSLFGGYAH